MDLRFPVGAFEVERDITAEKRAAWIEEIRLAPVGLRAVVDGLNDEQLDTPYRPEGWTVRQVVHHLPDSHLTSYVRFKLALTEDKPPVRGYDQDGWSQLPDARGPIEPSLALLETLHVRWVYLLSQLTEEDFQRTILHSESGEISLSVNLCYYAWHGRNHTAQITALRERMSW